MESLLAAVAAFSAYFCMYAFRKPFAVAHFAGAHFAGSSVTLKTALVISQILGYTVSKYAGIKVCSEAKPQQRAAWLVGLVVASELALVLFAVLPDDWKVVGLFLNGLPLGMVWGLVVSFLEGRRSSDMLMAALCCSFIISSGVVKDIGAWLMNGGGVSEAWMPAATGALFLPLFLLSVAVLRHAKPPTAEDVAARTQRGPMDKNQRHAFFNWLMPTLLTLIATYLLLTAYRDFRDNYAVDIFKEAGLLSSPGIFSRMEIPVAFAVMACMAVVNIISDHKKALHFIYGLMILGFGIIAASTMAYDNGMLSVTWWLALVGLGAYMSYVPFNAVLFERLMAATKTVGTAVFAIYLADAFGYTGSIGVQLYKDFFEAGISRLAFFRGYSYVMAIGGATMLGVSMLFLRRNLDAKSAVVAIRQERLQQLGGEAAR